MSLIIEEQLPSGLIEMVSKLAYFKTERRKMQCDVSSVSPNGQVRVRLPTSGLCNLSSLSYHYKIAIATADSVVPVSGCLINTLRVTGDGQTIDEINNYSLLFQSLLNVSCSDSHAQTRYSMGTNHPKAGFSVVDVALTATDATIEAAATAAVGSCATNGLVTWRSTGVTIASSASKWCTEVDWLGFLATDYIMLDQWPALTIEFTMEGNNVLGSSNGTWSISDHYFCVDIISYAAALESFMSLFERNPGTITPITYAFDRYVVQLQAAQASTTNSINFNIASSNLRKLMYTYRKNAFATQAAVVAGNHASNYYIFSAGDAGANFTTSNLFIDGKQHHQYPVALYENEAGEVDSSGLVDTLVSLGLESDNQFDFQINSFNDFVTRKFLHLYNFDWRGSGANEISGINTNGSSSMQLVVKSDAALTAGGQWCIMAQCSTLVHVSPNRVISIEF